MRAQLGLLPCETRTWRWGRCKTRKFCDPVESADGGSEPPPPVSYVKLLYWRFPAWPGKSIEEKKRRKIEIIAFTHYLHSVTSHPELHAAVSLFHCYAILSIEEGEIFTMSWALMIPLGMVVRKKKERVWECVWERGKKKRGMKMPSVMSYLDTSLIQEWGAYPVNGKIWCTLGHYEWIVLQQFFFFFFCCWSCLVKLCCITILQSTQCQPKCNEQIFFFTAYVMHKI